MICICLRSMHLISSQPEADGGIQGRRKQNPMSQSSATKIPWFPFANVEQISISLSLDQHAACISYRLSN